MERRPPRRRKTLNAHCATRPRLGRWSSSATTPPTSSCPRAPCCATSSTPRAPGSTARCAPTTSRRGASARASPASRGRGSARRWPPPGSRSAWSTRPGQRYHPVIVAQAIATLEEMFPGRFWAALGSGEAMNEHITGDPWPPKDERNARLDECSQVIRGCSPATRSPTTALVARRTARASGRVRPRRRPSSAPRSAPRRPAGSAGGPTGSPPSPSRSGRAAPRGRGVSRRRAAADRASCRCTCHWRETDAEALAIAEDQWRNGLIGPPRAWDFDQPEDFDAAVGRAGRSRAAQGRAGGRGPDRAGRADRRPRATSASTASICTTSARNRHRFLAAAESDLLPALRRML